MDTIMDWWIPLVAVLAGIVLGGLVVYWFARRNLARIEAARPVRPEAQIFIAEDERAALRSVVGEMRLNALMVDETTVIWSWAPFDRRALDNAQWLFPGMPPVVAEAIARANRKVTEYNSIAEFANAQDQQVHQVAMEARTALVIAAQRLEEYLTGTQMEQGRRGLRLPRAGVDLRNRPVTPDTSDWQPTD
jgi:hypothetical protein